MTAQEEAENFKRWAQADFAGAGRMHVEDQKRIANAVEFAAFRLGQIDDKLGQLIRLLEAQGGPASPTRR